MRDRDLIILALAVVLAGCPLGTSTTTMLTGGRTTTVAPAADTAAATAPVASSPAEPGITGAIVRRQLEALHGLTPDDAKQQLKKLGHDG